MAGATGNIFGTFGTFIQSHLPPLVVAADVGSVVLATDPVSGQKTYTLASDTTSITLANVIAAPEGLSAGQWLKPESRAATEAEFQMVGAERVEVPVAAMGALWGNRAVEPAAAHRGMMNPDGTLGNFQAGAPNLDSVRAFNGGAVGVNTGTGPHTMPNGNYVGQVANLIFGGSLRETRVDGAFRGVFRNGQHKIFPNTLINSVIARQSESWILRWNGTAWERMGGIDRLLNQGSNWRENYDGTLTAQILGQGSAINLNPGQHVVFDINVPFQMANPTAVVPIISDYNATSAPALGIGTIHAATSPIALIAFPAANTISTVRIGGWHMGASGSLTSQVGVINVLLDRVVPDYAALGGIANF